MTDALLILALLLVAGLAVRSILKTKKRGGCSGCCPGCSHCHTDGHE